MPFFVAPTQRNYYDKQVSSYIYCLDEKKAVKVFLSSKYNIEYHKDEILDLLIKKYKKLNISASTKIPNITDFINSIDYTVSRIRFELNIPCDSTFSLNKLPLHLTSLSIICDKLEVPLNHLPPTLCSLQIKSSSSYDWPLDFLPTTLETLHIDTKYNLPLNNLPYNLKTLQIREIEIPNTLNCLPPHMKVLSIVEFYEFRFNNLPESLEEIAFPIKKHVSYNLYNDYEYLEQLKKDYPKIKILTHVSRSFPLDD